MAEGLEEGEEGTEEGGGGGMHCQVGWKGVGGGVVVRREVSIRVWLFKRKLIWD